LADSLAALTKQQVLVGIPATTAQDRTNDLLKALGSARGRRKARLMKLATKSVINNAELLFIHTNGSPLRHIPARPVIEPAIEDSTNKALIVAQLELAAQAAVEGRKDQVTRLLKLAGTVAEVAVRGWFTNPKNHWAPNVPSTIRAKGSDKPLIDTGELRKSITYVVEQT
jgi:hypothetical protein